MANLRRARKTDERTSVDYHNPRKATDPLSASVPFTLLTDIRTYVPTLTCARHNVGFPWTVDISIVAERPAGRQPRRQKKEEERKRKAREREKERGVKVLTAVVRVCLFCGHLLPATPEGWPCPSVFGERLSFDRRQTTPVTKACSSEIFSPVDYVGDSASMGELPISPFVFPFSCRTFLIDTTRERACE